MTGATVSGAVERAWCGDTPARRCAVALLVPASLVYGAAIRVRNACWDLGLLTPEHVAAHVVSVGNLTVGGSGKTPVTIWLAEAFMRRGRRVGVVARGYGKRRVGVVVVGVDGRPLVTPEEGGDEAVLVARRLAVAVVTGERRVQAARRACTEFGCDTIVLDDGFQHRALARDADLVLVGADGHPARLLPAGPLRESVRALERARAVLALGDEPALPAAPRVPAGVAAFSGRIAPSAGVRVEDDVFVAHDLALVPRQGVIAVAGVARPERFWRMLDRLGIRATEHLRFPDHHAYGPADVERLQQAGAGVVTTEKDLVKLARVPGLRTIPLHAIRLAVEVKDGERLVDLLLQPGEVALRPD